MIKEIVNLMKIFERENEEIYIVGGYVRDMLFDIPNTDIDLVTSASQKRKEEILDKYGYVHYNVGKHFLVSHVDINKTTIELATYRQRVREKNSNDNIQALDILSDLKRRDFTINSFIMDSNPQIYDKLNAFDDLKERKLKSIGNPYERIEEDPIRILRAYRFVAEKDLVLDDTLKEAIKHSSYLLKEVSIERIGKEIRKILESKKPYIIIDMVQNNVFDYLDDNIKNMKYFNQNNKYHHKTLDEHTKDVLFNVAKYNNLNLNVSAFLHDIGKINTQTLRDDGYSSYVGHEDESVAIIEKSSNIRDMLGLTKDELKTIKKIIKYHGHNYYKTNHIYKLLQAGLTVEDIKLLILLKKADSLAHKDNKERLLYIDKLNDNLLYAIQHRPLYIKNLKVDGNDIKKLGFEGKDIKNTLTYLHHLAFLEPSINNKGKLIDIAKRQL